MKEILVDADRKHLPAVQALIDTQLAQAGCPPQVQIAIDVAVEEIFINRSVNLISTPNNPSFVHRNMALRWVGNTFSKRN